MYIVIPARASGCVLALIELANAVPILFHGDLQSQDVLHQCLDLGFEIINFLGSFVGCCAAFGSKICNQNVVVDRPAEHLS